MPTETELAVSRSRAVATGRPRRADRATVALYALAMLLSAALLFSVQPMVARFVLPILGGTPAVWTVSVLFFQAALLSGYLYAHVGARRLGARRLVLVHAVMVAAPALVLPLAVPADARPSSEDPELWLLALLATTVGLPFLALSATAPLLQRWLAASGHPAGADPYFLYAASNVGSLAGLLGYPLLVEPRLGLATQGATWSAGYVAVAVLVIACGAPLWRRTPPRAALADGPRSRATPSPGARDVVRWCALAAVPSSLMLAATELITTDLGPVPLLWTVPLALYLLSFVAVFGRGGPAIARWAGLALPPALIGAAAMWTFDVREPFLVVAGVHLAALALTATVAHGRLAATRPAPEHLTTFYLALAAGGVLGGACNSLLAPLVFDTLTEYPIALVLAAACMAPDVAPRLLVAPPGRTEAAERRLDALTPVLLLAVLLPVLFALGPAESRDLEHGRGVLYTALGVVVLATAFRPARLALALGAALTAIWLPAFTAEEGTVRERSFFGRLEVEREAGGRVHRLSHGTTLHGIQVMTADGRPPEPLTYFHRSGPAGDLVRASRYAGRSGRVGVVGLGAGSMACHAEDGEHFTFLEIDPAVVALARDPRLFTFLADCPGRHDVVLGDARLALRDRPADRYGLLVLDAFSSDAIPTHLLTREAVGLYGRRLQPGGIVGFHVSNRYVELEPPLGDVAAALGLTCLAREDGTRDERGREVRHKADSRWLAMARAPEDLSGLDLGPGRWRACARARERVWTDDFTDVLSALRL